MKPYFSENVKSFLHAILDKNPKTRLGGFEAGCSDDAASIRRHSFFEDIDWNAVKERTHMAPFVPLTEGPEDC